MENNIKEKIDRIVEYVSQSVSLWRRLEKKKVTLQTAKLAFMKIDSKRKGYWDLTNVYELCGDITENQLFHVFKWLDISKSGDITISDIQKVLVSNQKQSESNVDAVEQVKDMLVAFIQNVQYLQGLRKKFSFSQELLSSVYRCICQQLHTQYLTLQDMIAVFSQNKKWDDWCTRQLKNMFKGCRNITEKSLYQAFILGNIAQKQNKNVCHRNQNYTHQKDEQQLLDGICENSFSRSSTENNQFQKQKQKQSPRFNKLDQSKTFQNSQYKCDIKKTSNLKSKRPEESSSYSSNSNLMNNESFYRKENNVFTFKEIKQDHTQVDSILSNIQKRRQQLRKGSLQRKKLIEQTLQRKKQLTSFNPIQSPKWTDSKILSLQQNYTRMNQRQNYSPKNLEDGSKFDKYQYSRYMNKQKKEIQKQAQQTLTKSQSSYFQDLNRMRSSYAQYPSKNIKQQFYQRSYQNSSSQNQNRFISKQRFYNGINDNLYLQNRNIEHEQTRSNKYAFFDQKQTQLTSQNNKKFSQTMKEKLYQRPSSSHSSNHKEKYTDLIRDANIEKIIQKYNKEIGLNPSKTMSTYNQRNRTQEIEQPKRQKNDRNDSGLSNADLNSYGYSAYAATNPHFFQKAYNRCTYQRQAPQSYLREQQKGKIYRSIDQKSRSNSIQKQNILKKAQQEATRKIQQIQRRAKMKVLQRKSSAGFKWVK